MTTALDDDALLAGPGDAPRFRPSGHAADAEPQPRLGPEAAIGGLAALRGAPLVGAAAALLALSLALPLATTTGGQAVRWNSAAPPLVFAWGALVVTVLVLLRPPVRPLGRLAFACAALVVSAAPLLLLASPVPRLLDAAGWQAGFGCAVAALACLATASVRTLAAADEKVSANANANTDFITTTTSAALGAPQRRDPPALPRRTQARWARRAAAATPLFFGAWVLVFWQILTRALEVPQVLMPAPSAVGLALVAGSGVLVGDFVQTVLRAVLIGLAVGSSLGFLTGLAIDRSPFLQRGLLPLAALASTVPLVGIAPIMVMGFGFDWHSKAAVVALMTFFPMLVNTLAGLAGSGRVERDLMRSYGAGYWRTLFALRLPVALPFIFAALKIDSTLALIGAIVAEFFGSPTAGLGFRISTEAARLNMGLVWAAILVASLAGSLLYALIGWAERRATFWHPSIRTGR